LIAIALIELVLQQVVRLYSEPLLSQHDARDYFFRGFQSSIIDSLFDVQVAAILGSFVVAGESDVLEVVECLRAAHLHEGD